LLGFGQRLGSLPQEGSAFFSFVEFSWILKPDNIDAIARAGMRWTAWFTNVLSCLLLVLQAMSPLLFAVSHLGQRLSGGPLAHLFTLHADFSATLFRQAQ
jgi:hypothetical protein